MNDKEKGSQKPSVEGIVRIVEERDIIIKGGNNLPTFQAPPPPPKPKKK